MAVAGEHSVDFWDISGQTGLNATIRFKFPKSAVKSGEVFGKDHIFRFWNGTRYVAIPNSRITIIDNGDYFSITITGINQFN